MRQAPAELTLIESCAIALGEAAEAIDHAGNAETFLAAIEANHRLWLTLTGMARPILGIAPDQRMIDFVISMSYKAGRGIPDQHIETLIGINRELAASLLPGQTVAAVRQRAETAWRKSGPHGMNLWGWLVAEIDRKCRIAASPGVGLS